jgi:hypothetical protein
MEYYSLDTGHFALEKDGDLIANHIRQFLNSKIVLGPRKPSKENPS